MCNHLCRACWTCFLSSALASATLADMRVKAEINRDTWVSAVGQEQDSNNGGSSRLKLKGVQEFSIVDIDPKPFYGKVIRRAELHVKNASPERLGRVTVSTLASDWVEGTSANYARQKGASSFRWAKQDQTRWAFPESDILAASFSQGGTIWGFGDATSSEEAGWQVIPVDPAVIAARVAGVSHGFVLMDDVGSEYERNGEAFKWKLFPNRFVFSHEQGNGRPYFVVTVGDEDREEPERPGDIAQSKEALPPGEAIITWATPADHGKAGVVGFIARYATGAQFSWDTAAVVPQYLMPAPSKTPERVEMHLRDLGWTAGQRGTLGVRAVDGAGNLSAVATALVAASTEPASVELKPAEIKPFDAKGDLPKISGLAVAVIDALDKVHPVTGAMVPARAEDYLRGNHLWSAADKTVRLYAAKNEFVDFQVLLSGRAKSAAVTLAFDDAEIRSAMYRFRHVNTKAGPMPDPLLPQHGTFSLPAADESIQGQTRAALMADVYVPHAANAGIHRGKLTVSADGESTEITVELHVWDFTLPDVLSFVPEMNCYGLPPDQELAYYRMAHAHRTNLNRLGYSWRGEPATGCAPQWDGKAFNWDQYDRHYGPLLDGSAFADLPRKSVPVDGFYLPLNENWPLDVNKHFKGGYWADQALDAEYAKGFSDACGQFARHAQEKGWVGPLFEFYLNNKVYFKKDKWSKSSAPWVFDEPVNTQDFWALRYFGRLFREGVAPYRRARGPTMAFRCDISYPERQRDILDGLLDVNVCGGAFRQYNRLVMDRKRRNGQITFNYGSSNQIQDANVQPAAWCIDTWCLGADGVVPWQTVGKPESWITADPLSLFYPAPAGAREPVASVRLKSYRRGQQDVEYLTLLQRTTGHPRFAVAAAARQALMLAGTVVKKDDDDAGLVNYAHVDPATMWTLRLRIGATLNDAHPPAERSLANLRDTVTRERRVREIHLVPPPG